MKKTNTFLLALVAVLCCLVAVACDKDPSYPPQGTIDPIEAGSSLQSKFPLQGCIATAFFIPVDRISSAGMHRHGIFHPCRQNLLVRDASLQDFSSLQTEPSRQGCITPGFFILADRISSSGMHRHGIFHLCRQNLLVRDASPRDFSSLQTEFSRQGCIATGFFIPADKISSAGMHRPEIFHPCRQNLLAMDASSRKFSSLQTESPRQGCIAPGFFILADRIFSSGMHRLRNYGPILPGAPAVRRAHLNSPQRLPGVS